jgi:hypothetical protein
MMGRHSLSRYSEHLHHLIPQMIDDLDPDPPGGRFSGWAGRVAVQRGPSLLVDLGLERNLQRFVGIGGAQEIGVADEEDLLVVVGVDEPAGDARGAVAADLAGTGVEDTHAVNSDLCPVICGQ